MRGHDVFRILAVVAVVLTYVTILLGGNVAASDSGLACPDWPSCSGTFTPVLTGGVTVEWSHRLSAFTLSLTIVAMFALAVAFERRRRALIGLSGLALATVAGQAIMGGVVVLTDLSVWAVVIHLGLATVLFGVLLLVTLLSNLQHVPPRWKAWVRSASVERAPGAVSERSAHRADAPHPATATAPFGPTPPG